MQQNYSAQGIDGGINFNSDMVENLPYVEFVGKEFDYVYDYIVKLAESMPAYSFFISLVDAMAYELYFPNEIKSANCEVLKHLANLPELKDDWGDEKKLAVIDKAFKELSDPKHPVSIAMVKMQDVPEVRIIEGRDKAENAC